MHILTTLYHLRCYHPGQSHYQLSPGLLQELSSYSPSSALDPLQSPLNTAGIVIPLRISLISASNLPMASHLTQNKGQIFAMTFKALHNLVQGSRWSDPPPLLPLSLWPSLLLLSPGHSTLGTGLLAVPLNYRHVPTSETLHLLLFYLDYICLRYMSVPSFPSILCKKSPSQKAFYNHLILHCNDLLNNAYSPSLLYFCP